MGSHARIDTQTTSANTTTNIIGKELNRGGGQGQGGGKRVERGEKEA